MKRKITLIIETGQANVALVGPVVSFLCQKVQLDEITCTQMELSVVEAINTITRKAYEGETGKPVALEVEIQDTQIQFRLCDWGKGQEMNLRKPEKGQKADPSAPKPTLPTSVKMMSRLDYNKFEGKNILTMLKIFPVARQI